MHSLDAAYPLLLLLCGRCGDAVECVVSFHHSPVCLSLTRLDHLVLIVWYEELETVLRSTHGHHPFSHKREPKCYPFRPVLSVFWCFPFHF